MPRIFLVISLGRRSEARRKVPFLKLTEDNETRELNKETARVLNFNTVGVLPERCLKKVTA